MKRKKDLQAFQRGFFSLLRAPLNSKDRLNLDAKKRKWVRETVSPNDRLTSEERFEIYARQYWFRIMESLYDDFPGLRALMGDRDFEIFVREYIQKYPSISYTLRDFGSRIPVFIKKNRKRWGIRSEVYLQMAEMELAQIDVFDAAVECKLDLSRLGRDPLKKRFYVAPHVRLMSLDYPLDDLQVKLNQDGVREQLSNGVLDRRMRQKCRAEVKKLKKEKVYLAVNRYQSRVYFKRLEPWAFEILQSLKKGQTLGGAITSATRKYLKRYPDLSQEIGQNFQDWSSLGWLQIKKN